MGWVKRKQDEHVCKKPAWERGVAEGDIWQCDICKQKYIVQVVSEWDDQRDPGLHGYITWAPYITRYPGVTSWRDQ